MEGGKAEGGRGKFSPRARGFRWQTGKARGVTARSEPCGPTGALATRGGGERASRAVSGWGEPRPGLELAGRPAG